MKKNLISLYDVNVYQECLQRIGKLSETTMPKWGQMTAAQMFSHCASVFEVLNGKELKTPFMLKLFKWVIRKVVLEEKQYKKNSPTHPQYKECIERDFRLEKARLLSTLKEFYNMSSETARTLPHPLFGKMSLEEKGWGMYKHLDHHLRQFGV